MPSFTLAATHFFRHELDRSFAAADRAIALNPNNAQVLWVAGANLIFAGEGERGIALVRRAAALDPHQPAWRYYFGVPNLPLWPAAWRLRPEVPRPKS